MIRALTIALLIALPFGCGDASSRKVVNVDGSSTVYPISSEMARMFQKRVNKPYFVNVKYSGTGGGFQKYVRGETDLNDASRPIKPIEQKKAKKNKVGFMELPIAYDGVSVVVNPENDWVDHLTVQELKTLWKPDSKVDSWNDLRSSFPDKPIKLFGPGTDSGTFDYFTGTIVGTEGSSRTDYSANEDDNVLVRGVAQNKYALGYFGYAYYAENSKRLKIVPIKNESEPVKPTMETIANGTYKPLARPLFIYVRPEAADRPEVTSFVNFYLDNAPQAVKKAGYVPLPDDLYDLVKKKFEQRVTGTMFGKDRDLPLKKRLKKSLGAE